MKYHNIHTTSVDLVQKMILNNDYLLICNGRGVKWGAKKAYSNFMEDLKELFSGEDIGKMLKSDVVIQNLNITRNMLIAIRDGLNCCYQLKDTPEKIKALDSLKNKYRDIFKDYPKVVESGSENEIEQIKQALKPIENRIKWLGSKIKEISPKKEEVKASPKENDGLESVIIYIQAVNPEMGYLDRSMSVYSLKKLYDNSVSKQQKLKANG